ncbi:MAG: FAD-dependent monooxygenase [Gallionellaceae bacterium]|jgi:2-octaprenyl-6-methoxyphenol hydroxylase|nr:FAD-dependent monooxygenase [Gallionellaceae bacterium]
MLNRNCDLTLIGGGPVGASLALALRGSGIDVRLLEARPANTASSDARALALSYGSRLLLERIGVWDRLREVSAIRTIHISQRGSFGRALLSAAELDVPALGYVLPYAALQNALSEALEQSGIAVEYGASVAELQGESDTAVIRYRQSDTEHTLHTRLAVVADGGQLLAQRFPPETRDYGQSAFISHVTCAHLHSDTAYERFTSQGPVALLPFRDGYELVWTAAHERVKEMLTWDDATLLAELQRHFGDRVGAFLSIGKRASFPLGLRRAPDHSPMPHTVLLGNAAQTLHPVAGQGFNLGLRDAWELAQLILRHAPEEQGSAAMLAEYRKLRRTDREGGIRFTDGLVRLFSNDIPLVSTGRAAALSALDCLPFAKKFVARRMMFGVNG